MTSFVLNGMARGINAEPGTTALDYLRLRERLTGSKEGCAEGDCGACTIAIGRPKGDGLTFAAVNSCIMMAADLDGCVVVTSEGLAENGVLVPVQQAMVDFHASQCGFCTPGFVMSLFALSQNMAPDNPREKTEMILDALAGNLCRCTGYRPILAAAESIAFAPDPRTGQWRRMLDDLADDDPAPRSLAALDALLVEQPDAKLVGGATDLGVGIAKHGRVPAKLVSLLKMTELHGIEEKSDHLLVGASATYSEILPYLEKDFPNFAALVRRIGSLQIRNLGTMGGNVCNASPIGDSAPCLIALGAVLILHAAGGEREINIDKFFKAYRKTALQPGEYLRAIKIPYLREAEKFFAYKLAKRFDQDISTVAGAFKIRVEDGVIVTLGAGFGGMAATPVRARQIETLLTGQPATSESFQKIATKISNFFTPLSDFRASADYRLAAAAGFINRLGAQTTQPEQPADIWAL